MTTKNTIKWTKIEGEPVYRSVDGRFEIDPLYLGRERPQGWEVTDNSTKQKRRTYSGLRSAKDIALAMLSPSAAIRHVPSLETMQLAYRGAVASGQTEWAAELLKNAAKYGYTLTA